MRVDREAPTAFERFEWLAAEVGASRHGLGYFERPMTAERLAMVIEDEETYIAVEVALRTTPD